MPPTPPSARPVTRTRAATRGRLQLGWWTRIAAWDGLGAAWLSRLGAGGGSIIGARVTLHVHWQALSRLGRAQTSVRVDVPAWVRATGQVDPDPQSWAVAGSLAGGTCALQPALTAPPVYATFLDIAGQAEPTLAIRARTAAAAFGADTAGVLIVGSGDATYRPPAPPIAHAAHQAGWRLDYRDLPGGHDRRVSRAATATARPWPATRLHLTP